MELTQIFQILVDRYNTEELRTLCFLLKQDFPELDYENLAGDGKSAKARELIEFFLRRDSLPQFLRRMVDQRPDLQDTLVIDVSKSESAAKRQDILSLVEDTNKILKSVPYDSNPELIGHSSLGAYNQMSRNLKKTLDLAKELISNPSLLETVDQAVILSQKKGGAEGAICLLSDIPVEQLATSEDWLYLTIAKGLVRVRRKAYVMDSTITAIQCREFDEAIRMIEELVKMDPNDENLRVDIQMLRMEKCKFQNERASRRVAEAEGYIARGNMEQATILLEEAIDLPDVSDVYKMQAINLLKSIVGEQRASFLDSKNEQQQEIRFRKNQIEKQMNNHNRRLQKLKEQKALYGASTEPHVLIEIEDIQAEIEKLQIELKKLD